MMVGNLLIQVRSFWLITASEGQQSVDPVRNKSNWVSSELENQFSSRTGTSYNITILNVRLIPSNGLG